MKSNKLSKRLKDPEYMMTDFEFLTTANATMPDELLEIIYSWDKKKKSPYGNNSYYNGPKSWDGFIDGGLRVSDHWNFEARMKVHCMTKQEVENNKFWYIGKYDVSSEIYDIIAKYPIINRKRSTFIEEQIHLMKMPSDAVIEERRKFIKKVRAGYVSVLIDNDITKIINIGKKNRIPYVVILKDGIATRIFNFKMLEYETYFSRCFEQV